MKKKLVVGRRGFSFGFLAALFAYGKPALSAEAGKMVKSYEQGAKGVLYPIGGAAEKSLSRFAELAGAESARILILPHSSSAPEESAEELSSIFMALGVKKTESMMPGENRDLTGFSAVFMTGGDQNRIMRKLPQSFITQLSNFLKEGHLVGGTSAGAAALPERMIAGGMSDGLPKTGSLLIAEGLGLLPGFLIDTHVGARGRHDRLMAGLSVVPGVTGIGLDEDTAVEIRGGRALVWGQGVAHVYRRAENFRSALPEGKDGSMSGVENVIYSIYPAGESFQI